MNKVNCKIINKSNNPLPNYQSEGAAAVDLTAFLKEDIILKPLERSLVPTGIQIALPKGYEAQVRPRSGLALKKGISVLNSPGTIDSDYRGDIGVILINLSNEDFIIHNGDRIAQLIVTSYSQISWVEQEKLDVTGRGKGGFGSTGVKL
ncbi:MAG: deoxyuridine 5'-triphosphate nucleotidohydrolase [Flavobacteriales bacterium TMED113]|nr:MAG: deoxyuridine 5'-triphosphate nucleotidohydrolase [Flavobacteriales bacterium TMED113]